MKILFMSDFHIGSPLFKYKNLMEILTSDEFNEVYLLGDIFDIWHKRFNSIVENNLEFIGTVNKLSLKKNVYFVKGNHDPSIEELRLVFPNVKFADSIEVNKRKFYGMEFKDGFIIHGEIFDSLATKYSLVAKFLYYFQIAFEHIGINLQQFFRESFFSISDKSDKEYFLDLIGDIEDSTINLYENKYSYLVMGHTHTPKHITVTTSYLNTNFQYINCGDWISNHSYVVYDNGVFNLYKGE